MRYNRFIQPIQLRTVVKNLLLIVRLVGALLVVPGAVAFAFLEIETGIIFAACGAVCFAPGYLLTRGKRLELASADATSTRDSLIVVALAYLLVALVGMVPFLTEGAASDAFFESMSGITTTGFSMFDPVALPRSLVFFRSYLQWIGGIGITILSIVVLIGPGRNAYRLYASEFGEENLAGSVVQTARVVALIYLVLTAAGFLLFLATGFPVFDALLHVMSSVSTGGFSSRPSSVGAIEGFAGPTAPAVATAVMMTAGAVGFPCYYAVRRRGLASFAEDIQLRTIVLLIVAFAVVLYLTQGFDLSAVGRDLFHLVSALTTTGFSIEAIPELNEGRKALLILLMFVGGSAGSTAGGLKILRLLILLKTVRWFLLKHFLPEEARVSVQVGGTAIDADQLREAIAVLVLLLLLAATGAVAFTLTGSPFLDGLFDSVSATSTVGLSAGVVSPAMSGGQKLMVVVLMWAGRLEVVPLLVLAYPTVHKRTGGR